MFKKLILNEQNNFRDRAVLKVPQNLDIKNQMVQLFLKTVQILL